MNEIKETCGNCKWNRRDKERDSFYCGNWNGEYYALDTAFGDYCREFEVKDERHKSV